MSVGKFDTFAPASFRKLLLIGRLWVSLVLSSRQADFWF